MFKVKLQNVLDLYTWLMFLEILIHKFYFQIFSQSFNFIMKVRNQAMIAHFDFTNLVQDWDFTQAQASRNLKIQRNFKRQFHKSLDNEA